MKPLSEWLAQYAESHQNPTNRWIHKVCVPAIFVSIAGMLSLLRWPGFSENPFLSLATLVGLGTLIFYFLLGWRPFFLMLFLEFASLLFCYWLETSLPYASFCYALIFIVAWIGQFIGHAIEGKKPSFLEDIKFLLIGPLWVFTK